MQVKPVGEGDGIAPKHHIEPHAVKTTEERAVEKAVNEPFEELGKTKFFDFTGNAWDSFLRKVARFLDFTKYLGGALNSNTIIRGSLKEWNPERLEKKHVLLNEYGAEHLQFTSKTHEKVDAHYLDASKFLHRLDEMGGKRKVLKFDLPKDSPFYSAKRVHLLVKTGLPITMHELDTSKIDLHDRQVLTMAKATFRGFNKTIVRDETTDKFYAIDLTSYERLLKETDYRVKGYGSIAPTPTVFKGFKIEDEGKLENNFLNLKQEISAIEFKVDDFKKHKDLNLFMHLSGTGWSFVTIGDSRFLVRRTEVSQAEMFFLPNRSKDPRMTMQIAEAKPLGPTQKAILLTQNQSSIYEQSLEEMFTYALEGINVLVYNNPSKGLSTGLADNTNVNASIEAAYFYLHEVKKFKDEDIIAKGQCFGAAPTGWLGKEHPQINLMMDQNLANFHEKAMNIIRTKTHEAELIELVKKRKEVNSLKPKVKELLDLEESIRKIFGIQPERFSKLNKEYDELETKMMALDPWSEDSYEIKELMEKKRDELRAVHEKSTTIDKMIKEIVVVEDKIQKLNEAKNRSETEELEEAKEDLADLERKLFEVGGIFKVKDQLRVKESLSKMVAVTRRDPSKIESFRNYLEKISELEKSDMRDLEVWAPYIIKLNYIIEGTVKAIFSGYNTAEDLRANQGNKLIHINVPGIYGGGDELVLPHHPELMIDGASLSDSQKVLKLSMNSGGVHVSPWWLTSEPQEAVMDFFKKTDFLANLTETASEFGQVYRAVPTQFSSLE